MLLDEVLAALDELAGRGSGRQAAAAFQAARPRLLEIFSDGLGHRAAAKALTVKILNLLLAKWDLRTLALEPRSRPYGLALDPANGCSLHCPGCVHSLRSLRHGIFDWPAGMLSFPDAARFFREFGPYAVQAILCNYGEPLLNPETPRLIALARTYLLQTSLATSLSVRFDADACVRSGLDYMIFSIDGATQPVYERYRRNGRLDLVLDNAARLVQARRRLGAGTPVLHWQFLAFEHNVHEIARAREIARQIGVDEFSIALPFDVSWDDPDLRPAAVPPGVEVLNPASEKALPRHWREFPPDLDEPAFEAALARPFEAAGPRGGPGRSCRWLYKNTVMDAGARILPCTGAPEGPGDLVFGPLAGDPDPYTSTAYRRARLWFADRPEYERRRQADPAWREPYCVRCPFVDSPADIDAAQVAGYLRAAGPVFSSQTITLLSEW